MATRTSYYTGVTGLTLYAFPYGESLADWTTLRVAMAESEVADDEGLYSADFDDSVAELWAVFAGADQPAWNDTIGEVSIPRREYSPFLDQVPPSDWIIPITDRGVSSQQRRIEVRAGEEYVAAWDCRAIMGPGQKRLFSMAMPTCSNSSVVVTPTSDPANPKHGVNGSLAMFGFAVGSGESAPSVGDVIQIVGAVRPTEYSLARPYAELVVIA